MILLIDAKTDVTAKLDGVKATGKTLRECKVEKEKRLDKKIKAESPIALPPHFATTFGISILICIHLTFTLVIFNFLIFNSFVSDPVDHHFQTFTVGRPRRLQDVLFITTDRLSLGRNLSKGTCKL